MLGGEIESRWRNAVCWCEGMGVGRVTGSIAVVEGSAGKVRGAKIG